MWIKAVRAAHIDRINEKYKKTETVNEPEGITEQNTFLKCPRCGGMLVLRTAKKGANAGNSFYGCSNYPKCRYVQNI